MTYDILVIGFVFWLGAIAGVSGVLVWTAFVRPRNPVKKSEQETTEEFWKRWEDEWAMQGEAARKERVTKQKSVRDRLIDQKNSEGTP